MSVLSKIIDEISVVRQIPIFHNLNWLNLHKIAIKSTLVEYKKGDVIYYEDSPPDALYCLISGRLAAHTLKPIGKKTIVEYIYRGMHFGIISLLTGENHSLTMEAVNDSIVLKINQDDFKVLLKQIPQLGIEFSYSLSRRLKNKELHAKSIFESTIISVYSPQKNAGSSTYAINLAFSLQNETKKKVIFVDIHSSQSQEMLPIPGLGEATPKWKTKAVELKEVVRDYQKIPQAILHDKLPIDLLNIIFDPQELSLIDEISRFVSFLANDYHYVVVDLPNEMDDFVFKTLTQSDAIHLITLDEEQDLKLTRQVLDRLKLIFKPHFTKDKVWVLASGINPKSQLSYQEMTRILDFYISSVLPHIEPAELNTAIVTEDFALIRPDFACAYAKRITKTARQIGGVLVGLVLGGGAALGIAHIGVLRVLEREKIPIDIVVGSSIGALIGGLWVSGRAADDIEKDAREFSKKSACLRLLDIVFPKAGFIGGRSIQHWLRKKIGDITFQNTRIPFKVVAYDLIQREELVIDEGHLIEALRQSIAIPGVITPVIKKDQLIIDGGVVNPLPVNVLASLGIKKIIAVNVLQSPADVVESYKFHRNRLKNEAGMPFLKSPGIYLGVRMRRLLSKIFYPNISAIIIGSLQATEYVIAEQSAQQTDILIHPDLKSVSWFEFYQVDRLIKAGEEAAISQLENIKKLIRE